MQISFLRWFHERDCISLEGALIVKWSQVDSVVYALYYAGDEDPYAPLRSNPPALPVFVGSTTNPRAHMPALVNRIKRADLNHEDFILRYVVTPVHWARAQEEILKAWFHPVWNALGFGRPGRSEWGAIYSWSSPQREAILTRLAKELIPKSLEAWNSIPLKARESQPPPTAWKC